MTESVTIPENAIIITKMELNALMDETVKKAIRYATAEAIKVYETRAKAEYKERADKRLRNTKMLLRNYRMLKKHAAEAVFTRDQVTENAFDILESMMKGKDDFAVESIQRSVTRTAIMIDHIDSMLESYRRSCNDEYATEADIRRYEVLYDMYIGDPPMSADEIADKYFISKSAVYADLRVAIERMTALLFGVDGLMLRK